MEPSEAKLAPATESTREAEVQPLEAKVEPATESSESSVSEVPPAVQDDGSLFAALARAAERHMSNLKPSAKPFAPSLLPIGTKVLRNGQEAEVVGIDHSVYPKGYIVRMQSDGREVVT